MTLIVTATEHRALCDVSESLKTSARSCEDGPVRRLLETSAGHFESLLGECVGGADWVGPVD